MTPEQVREYLNRALAEADGKWHAANSTGDPMGMASAFGQLCGAIRCASSDLEFMQRRMDREEVA